MEVVVFVILIAAVLVGVHRRGTDSGEAGARSEEPKNGWARPQPIREYGELVRLAGCNRVRVVGESHYQSALKTAVQGRSSRGSEGAYRVQAMLVPEPTNPYDRRAVRVDVGGRTVGYLPRDHAEEYQPVLLKRLWGKTGWCVGRVTGGGDRHYGIYLHLSGPDCLVPINTPDGLELIQGDRPVTVAKASQHHDVIAPLTQGTLLPAPLFASLVKTSIERGKYAGETTYEVRVNDKRIGELTKTMTERYSATVSQVATRGRAPGCEAVIASSAKGLRVSLMMPSIDE